MKTKPTELTWKGKREQLRMRVISSWHPHPSYCSTVELMRKSPHSILSRQPRLLAKGAPIKHQWEVRGKPYFQYLPFHAKILFVKLKALCCLVNTNFVYLLHKTPWKFNLFFFSSLHCFFKLQISMISPVKLISWLVFKNHSCKSLKLFKTIIQQLKEILILSNIWEN